MKAQINDRNLLFGVIALQMALITRDALLTAMAQWAIEKRRSVGEILVENGNLDSSDLSDLESILDRRLAREGGDASKSLAAMESIENLASELRASIGDPELFRAIATASLESQVDPLATQLPLPDAPSLYAGRFRKIREHAAGNLGVIYVAQDQELNREVALKEIKPQIADRTTSQAKFLLEAEITGKLEHPGIVPVYGLGHYSDGRPYYAMRFIRGKSLLKYISEFHENAELKGDSVKRALELRKLLRHFNDLCNSVAYAHSVGVLHRDIKPDNVMVGKYGETFVVDWGLAKILGNSTIRPSNVASEKFPDLETAPCFPIAEQADQTQQGSLVGTPAYMSPEQASGRLDLLTPASDIYCLGATLFHLMVGRPPIAGGSLSEVLSRIQSGDLPRPRSIASWIDPALEAVCIKAMAVKPVDRYKNPLLLVDDIERWIADERVLAYREPIHRKLNRWNRKNPLLFYIFIVCLPGAIELGLLRRERGPNWTYFDMRNSALKDVQQKLDGWKLDPNLSIIREPNVLESLPKENHEAIKQFWEDVDGLRERIDRTRKLPLK